MNKVRELKIDSTLWATPAKIVNLLEIFIKDNVANTSLTSQLNNLKSQHITTEVTGIDNKTKKNASDILALKNELEKKEYAISENEREISIFRDFFSYLQQR